MIGITCTCCLTLVAIALKWQIIAPGGGIQHAVHSVSMLVVLLSPGMSLPYYRNRIPTGQRFCCLNYEVGYS